MAAGENTGALSRGRVKIFLMRDLALGAESMQDLAYRYGVTTMAISAFAKRHANHITEIRGDLESEWAGVWIADRQARIAEIQQLVEDMNDQIAEEVTNGGLSPTVGVPLVKMVLGAYEQVARELGQITKPGMGHQGQPPTVLYTYGGFDQGDVLPSTG